MKPSQNSNSIEHRLRVLRRRFYGNEALRGGILFLLLLTALGLGLVLTEGVAWLAAGIRTALLFVFALLLLTVLVLRVCIPLLRRSELLKPASDADLASLVGKAYPEVADKLTNLLQLKQLNSQESDLLAAAIARKTESLSVWPIQFTVTYKPTLRQLRWLAVPVGVAALVLMWQPEVLTGGTYRLAHFGERFAPPPPFEIGVENHPEVIVAGESAAIGIRTAGRVRPAELYLFVKEEGSGNYQRMLLDRTTSDAYSYTFQAPSRSFSYYIGNELHQSSTYGTTVVHRPAIKSFYVVVSPPAYSGLQAETLTTGAGSLQALKGSRVSWHLAFKQPVKGATLTPREGRVVPFELQDANQTAQAAAQLLQSLSYRFDLQAANGYRNSDSVYYSAEALPDRAPMVTVQQPGAEYLLPGSGFMPLNANVLDDFGFSALALEYQYLKTDDPTKRLDTVYTWRLPPNALLGQREAAVRLNINWLEAGLSPGDEFEYVLRAWDNDGVSGPKSGASAPQRVLYASKSTVLNRMEQQQTGITADLGALVRQSREVQREIESLRKQVLEGRNVTAEQRLQLQNLEQRQRELSEKMAETQRQLEKNLQMAKQNQLLSKQTEQKLKEIKDLAKPNTEQKQDPEFKEFMKQMRDRGTQVDKRQMQQQLKNLEKNAEALKQQAERVQELFKRWKAEQKLDKVLQQVRDAERRQNLLEQSTRNAKTKEDAQRIAQKQAEVQEQACEVGKELNQLEQLQKEAGSEKPEPMDSLRQELQQSQEEMQQGQQELQQNDRKKAAGKMQRAAKSLQQMANRLQQMQQDAEQEQQAENYEDLRVLLENLLKLSFDQEELRDAVAKTRANDPAFDKKAQAQFKIRNEMRMVDDSLTALAKRVSQLKVQVFIELNAINNTMDAAQEQFEQRNPARIVTYQHLAMKGLNTLAGMLAESLQNMQMSMKQGKGKKGKPNSRGMGMPALIEMQQGLNNALEQMQQNGEGDPQKLAEQAAQQEAIRKQLKEAYEQMQQEGGKGLGSHEKVMEEMETSEGQLRAAQLTQELLARQQRILSRMLDFEKSMREREMEEQRQSQSQQEELPTNPAAWKEDELRQRRVQEQLNRRRLQYTGYYQRLVDDYFNRLLREGAPVRTPAKQDGGR